MFMLLLVGLIAVVNPLGAVPIFLSMSGKSNSGTDMSTINQVAIPWCRWRFWIRTKHPPDRVIFCWRWHDASP